MTPARSSTPPALPAWAVWGWLIAIAAITRPFRGIYHDGHLYAVQALRLLDPDGWDGDIFFAFGNQDSFTVFTYFYAPLIDLLGLFHATALLWAVGLLFWLCALLFLTSRIFATRRSAQIAALAAVCLYPAYGSGLFSYGEGHVTPRIWAEALSMFSIGAALSRRAFHALVPGVMALVLHPLTALPGLCIALWVLVQRKVFFAVAAAGAFAIGLMIGALNIAPFDWLFQQIDASWWEIIKMYVPLALVTEWWHVMALIWLPLPGFALWLVWRDGPPKQRDLALGALVVGALFTFLSLVFVDLLHNRFFAALQLWRAGLWVVLLGNIFAWAAIQNAQLGQISKILLLMSLALNAMTTALALPAVPAGLLALAAIAANINERRSRMGLTSPLMLVAVILALGSAISLVALLFAAAPQFDAGSLLWRGVALGILSLGIWSVLAAPRQAGAMALFACLPIALVMADQRSDRQVILAKDGALTREIVETSKGKTLYWEGEIVTVWFGLARSNFYSCRQKGGILFHREQAVAFDRRARVLGRLGTVDFDSDAGLDCPLGAQEPVTEKTFQTVCATLPDLDLVALRRPLDVAPRAVWSLPFSDQDATFVPVLFRQSITTTSTDFQIYACDDFR